MLKTQIGLGVLSIPAVFHSLGLIPGVIALLVIAAMTSWSNYIVGVFKMAHPDVYGIDDVGRKLFGRAGYEFFGLTFALCKCCKLHRNNTTANLEQSGSLLVVQVCSALLPH